MSEFRGTFSTGDGQRSESRTTYSETRSDIGGAGGGVSAFGALLGIAILLALVGGLGWGLWKLAAWIFGW